MKSIHLNLHTAALIGNVQIRVLCYIYIAIMSPLLIGFKTFFHNRDKIFYLELIIACPPGTIKKYFLLPSEIRVLSPTSTSTRSGLSIILCFRSIMLLLTLQVAASL